MKYNNLIDFLNDIADAHVNAFGAVGDVAYLDVSCRMKPKLDKIVTTLTIHRSDDAQCPNDC